MNLFRIAAIALAVQTGLASSVPAQKHGRTPTVFVPATNEITILDPGVNSEPVPRPVMIEGRDGQPHIDVPPFVIVHNYYYSGDRDFRGPVLPGGPSVVVVTHPVTSERLYLDVQMLPGSPRVTYRKEYIDYDFGARGIRIRFIHPLKCADRTAPTVEYNRGQGYRDVSESKVATYHQNVNRWVKQTGVPNAVGHVVEGTRGVVENSASAIHGVGSAAAGPVVRVMDATPVGAIFSPSPETRARRERDSEVRRVARDNRNADLTIPTLR